MSANSMQPNSDHKPFLSAVLHDRLLLFGGVILPVTAALFESTTHFCARLFFDPFPSASHLIMFLLIPLSNFMAWNVKREDMSHHYFFMALSSGMACGIAVMYSVMFLPILGLSLLFSLALGFGLLGLAPLIAIPCTMRSGVMICNVASKQTYFDPHQVKHIGHLIILVMVVAMELPSTMTRINLGLADNPASAARGVTWLRRYGSQEVMLRACYERSGRATDILGSIYESAHPLNIDHARRIYYRVTGKPFNSVPIPPAARATIQHAGLASDVAGVNAKVDDEFDLDGDIAGEVVSGVSRGLSACACRVQGRVYPDALLSKMDWFIDFQNQSKYDREARAKILLPRGGVVTGASVIVNGIERDATLMLRGTARVRYVQSVGSKKKKKDPLLVSTSGPDEVLVQCFPVQPGKPLSVHLSIVCPLWLDEKAKGVLGFPIIVERNFQLDTPVQISLDSPKQLSAENVKTVSCQRKNVSRSAPLVARTPLNAAVEPGPAVLKTPLNAAVEPRPPVPETALNNAIDTVPAVSRIPLNAAVAPGPAVSKTPLPVGKQISHSGNVAASLDSGNTPRALSSGGDCQSVFNIKGIIEHPVLDSMSAFVRAERDSQCKTVFCREQFSAQENLIRRLIRPEQYVQPKKLLIVVDGSENMRGTIDEVAKGLSELPVGIDVELSFVGDETIELCSNGTKTGDSKFKDALLKLTKLELIGGQDDSTVVERSLQKAAKNVNQSVLWIHGSQPICEPGKAVSRLLEESTGPLFYDFPVAAGPTQLLAGVNSNSSFVRVARSGSIESDLRSLGAAWIAHPAAGAISDPEFSSEPVTPNQVTLVGYETDSSLAQLYANRRIASELKGPDLQALVKIAADYHIVSPVSSAVVAEDITTEQITVNTAVAPESDTWLLMIVAVGFVYFVIRRKRLQEATR